MTMARFTPANQPWAMLKGIDVVFASDEDLSHDDKAVHYILAHTKNLVLTKKGDKGHLYLQIIKYYFLLIRQKL